MITILVQLIAAFTGSLGFALIYNIRRNRMFFAALGGLIAWLSVVLVNLAHIPFVRGWSDVVAYFAAAVVLTVYSEIMASLLKTPTTVFIVPAAIPIVPGGMLYYTMRYAVRGNREMFGSEGLHTLMIATAIAAGIFVAMTLWNLAKSITCLVIGRHK